MSTRALDLAEALTTEPHCTCHAACYYECGCDAIWPEQWIPHAASELRRLQARHDALREGLEKAVASLEEWGAYAPDWAKARWGFDNDMAALKAAQGEA